MKYLFQTLLLIILSPVIIFKSLKAKDKNTITDVERNESKIKSRGLCGTSN
jgi:hypothetical protein